MMRSLTARAIWAGRLDCKPRQVQVVPLFPVILSSLLKVPSSRTTVSTSWVEKWVKGWPSWSCDHKVWLRLRYRGSVGVEEETGVPSRSGNDFVAGYLNRSWLGTVCGPIRVEAL